MRFIRVPQFFGLVLPAIFVIFLIITPKRGCDVAHSEPAVSLAFSSSPPELRFWVDVTGKHSVRAALIETRGDKVYLEKSDGLWISTAS